MRVLRDPADLASVADEHMRALLQMRFEERSAEEAFDANTCGHFVIVEAGDDLAQLEQASFSPLLCSPAGNAYYGEPGFAPAWELLEEHPGFYEMTFILAGDAGVTLIVPQISGLPDGLLEMCAAYAVPAPDISEGEVE